MKSTLHPPAVRTRLVLWVSPLTPHPTHGSQVFGPRLWELTGFGTKQMRWGPKEGVLLPLPLPPAIATPLLLLPSQTAIGRDLPSGLVSQLMRPHHPPTEAKSRVGSETLKLLGPRRRPAGAQAPASPLPRPPPSSLRGLLAPGAVALSPGSRGWRSDLPHRSVWCLGVSSPQGWGAPLGS